MKNKAQSADDSALNYVIERTEAALQEFKVFMGSESEPDKTDLENALAASPQVTATIALATDLLIQRLGEIRASEA